LLLCFGGDGAAGLLCLGKLRAPDLSLRVLRDDGGECELELFMQFVDYLISVCWPLANDCHSIEDEVAHKECLSRDGCGLMFDTVTTTASPFCS